MSEDSTAAVSSPSDKYGQVGTLADGRRYVVFDRELAHPVEKVWAAITDPAQLNRWFPGFKPELRQGGRFEIWFDGEQCEGPAHVTGEVTRFEPPHVLECGSLRFELTPTDSGCTLRFTDILWNDGSGRSDSELANSVLGGWHRFLDALEYALVGKAFDHKVPEFDYSTIEVPGR